ncbi:NADPH-dependent F420 reductase [Anditalea andensis]|uniref:NADH-ubiquinone oxidoreductase n=1 Tax=Anditalea andensis TaxID=1048983 RepID=A0A074KW81_9BACT|nr:NAD(P)-binding domain-containing protein [Anditalea andensis]KEO73174.1 NADH-ubiquinone oxidoreductase [Anditalea andensis]
MKIGIIGGTKLAVTLGNKYLSRGIDVIFGVRKDFLPKQIEWKILDMQQDKLFPYCDAIDKADIIFLCCENEHLPQICACLISSGNHDKIIIDCTNGQYNPELGCNTSYIQQTAGHNKIVKAFNNLGLDYPKSDPLELLKETYFCGDCDVDKIKIKKLIELIGFKAIDAGKLQNAFLLEAFYHLRKEISFIKNSQNDYHFKLMSV